ncbi:choice-of-anchor J domain-containing protein [Myroides sp. WP-1]|uniref:choice-of-anchor J domain-containing protein n=1 Tax=Myroides sp. WP-1 TaxID=2759944 RepID=UPI0015FCC394|nr:choice-of-anchor J domain-containing protein [Myroides sp. WP-1]MBB1140813.1 choice-of-anchor J domain-containing protein [Myroides sp. WP-1]
MKKLRLRGALLGLVLIPTLVWASPRLMGWVDKIQLYFVNHPAELHQQVEMTPRNSTLLFEDEDEDCPVIAQFPFLETFSMDSETKPCWTVIDNNEDGSTWDLNDTNDPFIGDAAAVMTTDWLDGENDDWMISPTIQLNGNQRLRYYYKVESEWEPNDFRVMLSTTGTDVASFTHELLPLREYSNTVYQEEVIYLKDENGDPIVGEVNIAWHVPPGGVDGWRLYIDSVIVEDVPACPTPRNIQLSNYTTVGVQVDWSQGYEEEAWEVAIQLAGTAAPTTGTAVDETTYTATQLNSNTEYDVYVRAICDAEEGSVGSEWVGPIRFRTNMIPHELPFVDGFEGDNNFVFIGAKVNKWHIGTAVNNGGTHAMYISNDEGVSNQYTLADPNWESTRSHAYADFAIPQDVNEMQLSFDWRSMGEGEVWASDYFRVWVVPTDYVVTANEEIDELVDGVVAIGESSYKRNPNFLNELIFFDGTPFAGQNIRIVFEWLNDASGGVQPPAAIDNIDLREVVCSRPQDLHVEAISATQFTLGWTPVEGVENYELIIRTNPLPVAVDADVPTHTAVGDSYTFTEVNRGSFYYVWLRTACNATDKSKWIGPLAVNIPKIPGVTLPYIENFEGDVYFQTTASEHNKWVAGNAVSERGTRSLYVTKDEGISNLYFGDEGTVIHAFKDFTVPAGAQQLDVSFSWKAVGETTIDWDTWEQIPGDYFKVWIVPASFNPTGGTLITAAADRIEIDPTNTFFQQRSFTMQRSLVPATAFAGRTMRIVFEWIQNDFSGEQPPAIIDNLSIKEYNCPDVENIAVERIGNTSNFEVTWTAAPGQTKWEVFIVESGQPAPTGEDTGIIVEGNPTYIVENVEEGIFYNVFVRPVCSDTAVGWWSGPEGFSIFHPPGCASISLEDLELDVTVDGEYIICSEDPYTIDLKADFYDIKSTSQYRIEPIEYAPPFPFFGGDAVNLTIDDIWSDVIDLGFDFCFFGNSYDKVLISTNGAITFSIEGEVEGGVYQPNDGCAWRFDDELPHEPEDIFDATFVNAIFGAMQDLNPESSPDDYSVNYQILGEYPCRALVFNMYHMGLFGRNYDQNDIEGSTQTSQIVLYENTNIIEVYVKNRPALEDDGDGFIHNNANGVIGIQNADGTVAYVPEGRNTGNWLTQNEAWRFVPNGESIASFEWLRNGEFYSDETDIAVTITESTTLTGRIKYQHCNGDEMIIEKSFDFLKEPMVFKTPKTVMDCAKKPGVANVYNLEENIPVVLDGLVMDDYTVEFYKSQEDATAGVNKIEGSYSTLTPTTDVIYMKITNELTHCSKTIEFRLGIHPQLGATIIKPIFKCKEVVLPALAPGEAYYTEPFGAGVRYDAGAIYNDVGVHTLYVYHEDENQCYGESSFKIEILPEVFAPMVEDKVLACEAFRLPYLPEGMKYYTEPNEGGIELKPEYEVIVPMTIYIVARNGNKEVYCYDETSFNVKFEECPIPKGISPNGDGINDSFDLSNHGVAKIQIFNRNGVEVYSHGVGYKDEFKGQDSSGKTLPSGTYYYVIVSHGQLKTGWLQLNY